MKHLRPHRSLLVIAPALASTSADKLRPVKTQWGTVNEPSLPATVCRRLEASLAPVNGSIDMWDANASSSNPDTARIQDAIDACPAGQAVKLVTGASGDTGFLSGPLRLKSGVSLWIDRGVTLFASRNPADFDNGAGTCGTATTSNKKSCNPLILAQTTTGSAILGDGTIDGRGGSLLTSGANAGRRTWWDVAYQNKISGLHQQNPRLVQVTGGSAFTLYRITLQNSPNFHIVTDGVAGVVAWNIKVLAPSFAYSVSGYACPSGTTPDQKTPATCFTPDTVKNTDGFDPAQSRNVLLAYSYISTGDDHVAIKASASPGSKNLMFAHNHFYYGHGMSIGSETNAGISNVAIIDLTMDGGDSPNGNGLRIKSSSSRGGKVSDVSYSDVCMRNVAEPLVFDSYYSSSSGTLYPNFLQIAVHRFHYLGSKKYGGGRLTFSGYENQKQKNPLVISLDNVVFDDNQPALAESFATHYALGPGPVSFSDKIVTSTSRDVQVSGSPGQAAPVDCSGAFIPLNAVVQASPI
ncbi:polygalacturonase [Paraburkholderia sp. CNPSo 3155]|nr:polygalacturonase [Paraburkholderia atlantica]